jgi:ATP-binding cassette subfamily C protein CydCD
MGLVSSVLGVARLILLGWLIIKLFAGYGFNDIWPLALATIGILVCYSLWEYQRLLLTQRNAASVQHLLRTRLFDQLAKLGPSFFSSQRSGEISNATVEGVEQLEIYFGRYLPQLFVAGITPIVIFAVVSQIDLAVATVLLVAALFTLFAPSVFQRWDSEHSMARAKAYREFASEFLDALQGLVTLKAFGQSKARESLLADKADRLFQSTMWVMATNSLARGITDIGITLGAASALALSAYRVNEGLMSFDSLLLVLLLGVEVFKPLRELRSLMHAGMLAQAAAKQVFAILDAKSEIVDTCVPINDESDKARVILDDHSVCFDNVSFSYPMRKLENANVEGAKSTEQLIHDRLSFSVSSGQQVGIVGSSGGGKSTILNLLMRFYEPQQGRVTIGGVDIQKMSIDQLRSQFAIVSQNTYLFHGTVRENLCLGILDASDEALLKAAQAANADEFIRELPQGYDTIIGERGIRLSGGQRQRLAIARALLRDTPILLLDEALSSVDARNESEIQQALDVLMQGRTTLVLAHRLASIINCDNILLLDQGRIAEQGNHQILMDRQGAYASLMASQISGSRATHQFSTSEAQPVLPAKDADIKSAVTSNKAQPTQDSGQNDSGPHESILQGDKHSWSQVLNMLLSYAADWKGRLILTFALGTSRVFSYIAVSVFSALAAAAVKNGEEYQTWIVLLLVSAVAAAVLHWLESWVAHDMAFRMLAKMRIKLFRKLESLAPAFMVRHRSGDMINLATHDIEMVEYFFAHTIAPVFVAVVVPGAILVLLASFSSSLALTLMPFLLLVFFMPMLFRKRIDGAAGKARTVLAKLSAHSVESLQGLSELLSYQAIAQRKSSFEALISNHTQQRMKFFKISVGQGIAVEFIVLSCALVMLIVAAPQAMAGQFDIAYLPLIALASMMAFLPVIEVADVGRQLADTFAATSRLMQVEESQASVVDAQKSLQTTKQWSNLSHAPKVEFKGLSFAYIAADPSVLSDIDLTLEPGTKVALVGPSGAGKSSLAHLLMRFWDPQQGAVYVDGVDITTIALDDYRELVAMVAQDTYLFNDTVKANLLMAKPNATEQQLEDAIEQAQLSGFIDRQAQGLDTVVGEGGFSLSGGQRQRLSIARAFLRDAPILILDEATSHLDSLSEAAVHKALTKLMQNRTTLVIAHRLASIEDADQIVVLDNGKIVEQGGHKELLASAGKYASLVGYQNSHHAKENAVQINTERTPA